MENISIGLNLQKIYNLKNHSKISMCDLFMSSSMFMIYLSLFDVFQCV